MSVRDTSDPGPSENQAIQTLAKREMMVTGSRW